MRVIAEETEALRADKEGLQDELGRVRSEVNRLARLQLEQKDEFEISARRQVMKVERLKEESKEVKERNKCLIKRLQVEAQPNLKGYRDTHRFRCSDLWDLLYGCSRQKQRKN